MSNNAKIFSDLERLAPLIPVPVFWLDTDGVGLGGNDLAFQVVGAASTRGLIIGKTPYEYYPKDVADIMMKKIKRVMQEKKSIAFEEPIVDVTTGKAKYFVVTRAPLFDDEGINVVGTIGTSLEITDRKERERLQTELHEFQLKEEHLHAELRESQLKTEIQNIKIQEDKKFELIAHKAATSILAAIKRLKEKPFLFSNRYFTDESTIISNSAQELMHECNKLEKL